MAHPHSFHPISPIRPIRLISPIRLIRLIRPIMLRYGLSNLLPFLAKLTTTFGKKGKLTGLGEITKE